MVHSSDGNEESEEDADGELPSETLIGRIYSYDYAVKLLFLKTVKNPGLSTE